MAKLKSERFLLLVPVERESKSPEQIKIVGHGHGQLPFDGRVNRHGSSSFRNKKGRRWTGLVFLYSIHEIALSVKCREKPVNLL